MILVLHLNETQLLLLVLADKADKLTTLLDLVQRFNKFVCEALNPFDVLIFDLDQSVADAFLPSADDGDVGLVLNDSLHSVCLDLLKLLQLSLVLLVDVVQVLRGDDTLETLVLLFGLRVESSGGIVRRTVDSKRTFWIDFLGLVQESVIDDGPAHVAFHEDRRFLFFFRVNQTLNDLKSGRVLALSLPTGRACRLPLFFRTSHRFSAIRCLRCHFRGFSVDGRCGRSCFLAHISVSDGKGTEY